MARPAGWSTPSCCGSRSASAPTAGRAAPSRPQRGGHRPVRFRPPNRPSVIRRLDTAGLLPAITFIFSRAGCDAAVQQCLDSGLRLTTPREADEIAALATERHGRPPRG